MVIELESKEEFEKLLKSGAMLVDVQEAEELGSGGLDYEAHWPLSTFASRKKVIPEDRALVFYCRSGLRSQKAAEIAAEWGGGLCYTLQGGYTRFR